jgi:hypothetical protein
MEKLSMYPIQGLRMCYTAFPERHDYDKLDAAYRVVSNEILIYSRDDRICLLEQIVRNVVSIPIRHQERGIRP